MVFSLLFAIAFNTQYNEEQGEGAQMEIDFDTTMISHPTELEGTSQYWKHFQYYRPFWYYKEIHKC